MFKKNLYKHAFSAVKICDDHLTHSLGLNLVAMIWLKNEIISTKFNVKMHPLTLPNGWLLNRGPSFLLCVLVLVCVGGGSGMCVFLYIE